jgi:Mlc titration factor MtfA (ptsG expression regulator)
MPTSSALALLILLLIVAAVIFGVGFWPRLRLARIRRQPFPAAWQQTLLERLPFVAQFAPDELNELHYLMKLFIADKTFYGCAGQTIDDRIRVTIAAQACLLVLKQNRIPYPDLKSILVYPSTFVATRDVADELGLISTDHIALLGESWTQGKVILAWDNVEEGVMNLHDGHNVVLHEFAHQLDHESGSSNGAPLLHTKGAYKSWAHVLSDEFAELQDEVMHGRQSLLDHYGATNPAEFFAVATETFFERPHAMAVHHQELYAVLREYYRLDPCEWQTVDTRS